MWRSHLYTEKSPITKTASCVQCPTGLLKYIEFNEFPHSPIRFYVDRSSNPSGSSGILEIQYWTSTPPSSPPFTNRVWLADIKIGGGTFLFQPTPNKKYISLFKNKDAVCFQYVPESRLFVPQTFN